MNNILIVSEDDLQTIAHWPIELRAIFDPQADLELAKRIASEKRPNNGFEPTPESGQTNQIDDDEIPF